MSKSLEPGDTFAIITGKFIGKFVTYVKDYGLFHQFLMMPGDWNILELTTEEYLQCFKTTSVLDVTSKPLFEFIEKIPDNIFEVIEAQYKYTKAEKNTRFIRGLRELL